jgi:hypothetical protein
MRLRSRVLIWDGRVFAVLTGVLPGRHLRTIRVADNGGACRRYRRPEGGGGAGLGAVRVAVSRASRTRTAGRFGAGGANCRETSASLRRARNGPWLTTWLRTGHGPLTIVGQLHG